MDMADADVRELDIIGKTANALTEGIVLYRRQALRVENVADSALVVIGRLKTFSPSVLWRAEIPVRGKGAGSYFNYRVSRPRKNAISSARPVMSER